jgi:large subunit ribosomal protein L10
MPRPEKVQAVADIKERIDGAQAVFLAEYAGLSVQQQQTLRRDLRAQGAEFKVVKMTLARLAAADLELEDLDVLLIGPTGLTFADGDPVGAAKALRDFAKAHEVLVIKGGLLGREFLTPERVAELADIEPREVLLAKIAGVMQAPMANMAGLLSALPRNAASVMLQLLEKKESGESPAPSDEVDEAPAAEEALEADEAPESGAADEAPAVEAAEEAPEAEETTEAEEAPEVEEAPEAEAEETPAEEPAEAAETEEAEAPVDEAPEADATESDDEAPAAEASEEEDAGTESEDTDDAADEAVEEE